MIHSPRGEVRGWEPRNELFDSDGVHLSNLGMTEMIIDLVAALKHVPKFKFEVDLWHWLERNYEVYGQSPHQQKRKKLETSECQMIKHCFTPFAYAKF